jgi:hypothetical protein
MEHKMAVQSNQIYQLKITLQSIKPSVWRIILVPSSVSFENLHEIIIRVFDWHGHHMYGFYHTLQGTWIGGSPMGDGTDLDDMLDARKIKISTEFNAASKINYMYDFGASWKYIIELQHTLTREPQLMYPICIKGKGGPMIEDCGGIYGYEIICTWARNKNKTNTKKLTDVFGEEFLETYADYDPDAFDAKNIRFSDHY